MSIREALETAVNTVEDAQVPATPEKVTPAVENTPIEKVEAVETPKEGRTSGRPRDEHGRLLPGKAEKAEAKVEVKSEVEPQVQRPPRPSSWKKEMWEHYDKLDPKVAAYVHQREDEFAKGVSTYKQDYERLRPVGDVLQQHEAFLRQQNIKPEQLVSSLMSADQTLRFGQPQDKLKLFAKLATDYQIPLHEMLVQGEDGKVYFNQQYFQPQQAQQPQGVTKEDITKTVAQQLAHERWMTAIRDFQTAKDDKGNPKYPHFETVKQTMDGLLRAGLAPDLPSAYTKSVRMHDDIWEADQKSNQDSVQKAKQEAQAKTVVKAKSAAVSVKSATPASETPAKGKGIRGNLEAAFDAHANPGRV